MSASTEGFTRPAWLVHLEALADSLENENPLPDRPAWMEQYPREDGEPPNLTLIQDGRDE